MMEVRYGFNKRYVDTILYPVNNKGARAQVLPPLYPVPNHLPQWF